MVINKVSLIASIILWGYNLSLFLNRYVGICEKALKYRDILHQEQIALTELRKSNLKITVLATVIYLTLLYFSEFSYWFLAVIAIKFCISLYFSDLFQKCVVEGKTISKSLFWAMKIDSLINLLGAAGIAVILVS